MWSSVSLRLTCSTEYVLGQLETTVKSVTETVRKSSMAVKPTWFLNHKVKNVRNFKIVLETQLTSETQQKDNKAEEWNPGV